MEDLTCPLVGVSLLAIFDGKHVVVCKQDGGRYHLPTGYMEADKGDALDAVRKVARRECGLYVAKKDLRLVGVWSAPGEDHRGHTVNLVYRVDLTFRETQDLTSPEHLQEVQFRPLLGVARSMALVWGHQEIVRSVALT